MNASLVCVVALMAAAPADAQESSTHSRPADTRSTTARQATLYRPSAAFTRVIRGQSPGGPTFQPPVVVESGPQFPGPGTAGPTFAAPGFPGDPGFQGGPTFGGPMPGGTFQPGPVYGGEPLPPSTVITPGVDPFLPAGPGIAAPTLFAPGGHGGHYFGYEAVFVKPYFSQNAAFGSSNGAIGNNAIQNEFNWDLEYSPRVWLGYSAGDGLGGRLRYWNFDEDVSESALGTGAVNYFANFATSTSIFGTGTTAAGQRIAADQDLELHVLDAEATWHREKDWGSFTAAAGIRYARLENGYAATVFNGNTPSSFLRIHREFEGAGPTLALLGRRRLWNTSLALFASGRVSLLYGDHEINARGTNVGGVGISRFGRKNEDLMPVTELQLGAEWSRPCRCLGGSTFFLRGALESQVWFDAGSGLGNSNTFGSPQSEDGNLGFFGFSFGGGWAF